MVQKRRQPAWKTENQRKRSKKIARKRRRVIAYTVRGIMAAVLAVMILLMICGCLYIRDFSAGMRMRVAPKRRMLFG